MDIRVDSSGGSFQSVYFGEADTLSYYLISDVLTTATIPVSYYLSDDGILDAGDQLIGVTNAEFSDSIFAEANIPVPAQTMLPGQYSLIIVADVPAELGDDNPADDIRSDISYTVRDPRPDITLSADPNQTASGFAGQEISYEVTITNNGLGSVDGAIYLYLSEDAVFDVNDTYVTFDLTGVLAPGESRTIDLGRELSGLDPQGRFTAFAEFDSTNTIELDTSDNVVTLGTAEILEPEILEPQPDLDLFFLVPMFTYLGDQSLATWRIQFINRGAVDYSGAMDISIYASADAVVDAGDLLLTQVTTQPFVLAAGDDSFIEYSYSDPAAFFDVFLEGTYQGAEAQFIAVIEPSAGSGGVDFDLSNNTFVRSWSDSPTDNDAPFLFLSDEVTIAGSNINDWVIGTGNAQVLSGRDGNDQINGSDGDDTIDGGAGDDSINGGDGADAIDGGQGIDLAYYAANSGRILVDLQTDVSGAGFARFFERGAAEGNTFAGIEDVRGAAAADNLRGDGADNFLDGREVSDRLYGRAGNDTLDGGTGADALYGNMGADEMTGGSDAGRRDRFIYFSAEESGVGSGNRDVITDFVSGEDRIELSRIDADLISGGKQVFSFVGDVSFGGMAGELRYEQIGGNTIVQADRDGDSIADMEIELAGTIDLSADDFLI